MARHGVSEARKAAAAIQAARRMIARGERPGYRLLPAQDGGWTVEGIPGVILSAASRREALDVARATIAGVLEVDPDTFDLEA